MAVAAVAALPTTVSADPRPAFADGQHAQVRLVPGGKDAKGDILAGVAVFLDHGFKTYWRMPGESGVPPTFDFAASTNLARAEVLWPVPSRFEDAGGVAYGYKDAVTFPVRVVPADPARPVELRLALAYGVCNDICIPARADLALRLDGSGENDPSVREALARVPKLQAMGDDGPVSVLAAAPLGEGGRQWAISIRSPAGETPSLFVEAPDGWFVMARDRPGPPLPRAPPDATGTFVADMLERPSAADGPIELRLTLATPSRAVETAVKLDTPRPSR